MLKGVISLFPWIWSPPVLRTFCLVAVVLAFLAAPVEAGRVPSSKTIFVPSSGARTDIFVPHLTNGRSTLGVAQGVAPIIIGNPGLGTENDAQVKPVFNLIYYGSVRGPNSDFLGAFPRKPIQLRPNR
jgi:hypothetical protein